MDSVKAEEEIGRKRHRRKSRMLKTQVLPLTSSASTGPRTKRGKEKSRYNALKHGIFARVVLRGSTLRESKAEYDGLLASLWDSLQPVGGAEELLVEKLASLAWRMARAVRAESAIITKQTEYLWADLYAKEKEAARRAAQFAALSSGIASSHRNLSLMVKAVDLLELLRGAVEERGFDPEVDERILQILFGESEKTEGLYSVYRMCAEEPDAPPKELATDESALGERKKRFLKAAGMELTRLEGECRELEERNERELPWIEESLAIPKEEELERILRYEARLEASFDRTLHQLERLQRLRTGKPLPPHLRVDVAR